MNTPDNSHDVDNAQDGDSHDHGAGISIVPAIVNEFGDDLHPEPEIKSGTLQRLTPQRSWEDIVFGESRLFEEANVPPAPTRHSYSMVSIIALAAVIGALSGAGTTWSFGRFGKDAQAQTATVERDRSIDNAIAQVSSELQTLKQSADTTAKANAARLAKLGETVEKLKSPAPDITGSIPAPAVAAPAPAPAPQFARLPTIDGWTLREVADGGATVEGRQGVFEVYPGDPLPGIGRINAIRRQDGRWVVVTDRGLIVSR
jgi:hypothetical protein